MDLTGQRTAALARVAELEAELAAYVEASVDDNADDEHDPEGHTIAYERAQLVALLETARSRVAALDAALAREASGTYGVCAVCGGTIGAERLAVLPATTTCVRCAPTAN